MTSRYNCCKEIIKFPEVKFYKNCCPIHVAQSSSTVIDKHYSTTQEEYLKRNCLTYETQQSRFNGSINNNRFSSSCCNRCIVYKVNNPEFDTQGAVSNSLYLSKLKYDTQIRGAGRYPDIPIPSNLVKSKRCNPNDFKIKFF